MHYFNYNTFPISVTNPAGAPEVVYPGGEIQKPSEHYSRFPDLTRVEDPPPTVPAVEPDPPPHPRVRESELLAMPLAKVKEIAARFKLVCPEKATKTEIVQLIVRRD